MILTAKICANCLYKFKNPQGGQETQCRFNPPSVYPIIVMTPKGPQVVAHSTSYPHVHPDWTCGQHKPGLAINAAEMAAMGEAAHA